MMLPLDRTAFVSGIEGEAWIVPRLETLPHSRSRGASSRKIRRAVLAALAALQIAAAGCRRPAEPAVRIETPGSPAPEFSLLDQENRPVTSRDIAGRVTVVIAANDAHGREMPAWEDPVIERFGGRVALVRLMDLSGLPRLARSFAQARIRQEMKGDPLALDWEGTVFRAFGFDPARVNAAIVDSRGILRLRAAGVPDAAARRRFLAGIEAALAASVRGEVP
ncbi:MAG: peroxiredoxin family protein [Planctomycetota bacterium]|nr:peroxiredoxin family protein [Planctomycetota bacterium]